MDLFRKIHINYNQDELQKVYLSNWQLPPNPSDRDVLEVGFRQFLIVSLLSDKNIDWGFQDFFSRKGLIVKETVVYISGPQTIGKPHLDVCKINKINEWALNIPIFNGTSGRTVWYDENATIHEKIVDGNLVGMLSEKKASECKEVAELKMDSPHMVRTNHLHTVENYTDSWRVNLSFRFKDISWEKGKEILCQ